MAKTFATVLLLGNGNRAGVLDGVEKLRPEIQERFRIVASDFSGQKDMSQVEADFAMVFGGDGSILRAVHQLGSNQIPILAVNLGSLGFLSNVKSEELIALISRPDFADLPIRQQILLECSIYRAGEGDPKAEKEAVRRLVVNEVALRAGPPFEIIRVELRVDGETAVIYRGDGLIISTPVGSTAHALSTGGPILRKDLDAIVIAPISPHSLSFRPVVDSADRTYELRVYNREVYVVIDGDSSQKISPGDRVIIRKADVTFQMFRIPNRNFYRTLREKLGWTLGIDLK